MLRDRAAPADLFALAPQLALEFEPVLARLDALLDDDTLFQAVKAELARRWPKTPVTGRPSTPVEVVLRLLVVRRLYGWSYAETEHFVSDSLVLRQFCRLGLERAPDDTTLIRPDTLDALLDHVVALARQLKVTRGRKLRVDSTVVRTPSTTRPTAACWRTACGCCAGWCGGRGRRSKTRWPRCGTPSARARAAPAARCSRSTALRGARGTRPPRRSGRHTRACAA